MEFLPTKGIEYLLAISYLLLLAPFWWFAVRADTKRLSRPLPESTRCGRGAGLVPRAGRLPLPSGPHVGQTRRGRPAARGHGRLRAAVPRKPQAFALPSVGERLQQGEKGWSVKVDGQHVSLLSPVQGEVAEVNADAIANPSLVQDDPYGKGWLLKVRAPGR